ncbi:MAG: hypothetical protein IJ272_08165 [Clostridia bacterium]|nr:hypothetical protein [Clostridia bacterium]
MATNYAINYDDKRFQEVEKQQNAALKETQSTYNSMINNSDKYYQQQINASKDWANKQTELQQAQTDFAIEKVNQAKDQAKKDYTREQKGAYTDYQKATNQYGVNAEQQAAQGLNQTGYSESTRVNAFNTYQNRYMSARESYNQAILNYDNNIKEAQLANNSALAKIAYEALQQQLELSLQGFQYKNTLLLQKLDAVNETKDRYYQRYQNVLQQINTENKLAEEVRQYNESLAEQKRQYNETAALNKQKLAEEIRQYNATLAFQKSQAAQEQARWEKEYALAKKKSSSSGSSGGSSGSKKSTTQVKDTSENKTQKSQQKVTQSSSKTNIKKTSTSTAPAVHVNGVTYFQDYTAAVKQSSARAGISLNTALKQGYIKSKIVNGNIFYAPVK